MSIEFVLHNEQVGFGKQFCLNGCLCAFFKYCYVLNFKSCLICASKILGLFQKSLDRWLSIFGS